MLNEVNFTTTICFAIIGGMAPFYGGVRFCKTTSSCNEQTASSSSGCYGPISYLGLIVINSGLDLQSLDCLPANVPRSLRPFDMDRPEIKLIPTWS